jgi:hypothetical protein
MAAVTTCAVLCIINDSVEGTPVEGARVEATLSTFEVDDGYVTPHKTFAITDVNGECTLDLWPNQLGAVESEYLIKITSLGKTLKTTAVIPNQPNCNLWEVAGLPVYDGLDNGSLIIGQVLAARDIAVAAAATATTQAGIATGAAGTATAQADISTTQAGIATGAATSANGSATLAQAWATQLVTPVGGGLYSARYYAIDAQAWAIKTDGPVSGGEYSAKYWAQSIAGGPVASWVGLTGTISLAQARTALSITNIDNTADAVKPVSGPTQTALDLKVNTSTYTTDMALKADLVAGKVPAAQLPAYVDDVLEFANLAAFPATGETGKIYVALDSNLTYRWGGSSYIEISASPGSTDAVPEGATNKYFTTARVLATALTGLSLVTNAAITAADTVLTAAGKLQKQITDLIATVAGKSDTITTVTKDNATGAALMPSGTTAQRGTGVTGKLRYSSTLGRWEGYGASAWGSLGGAAGGGNDSIFYESDATANTDYTITTGRNAMVAGPMTVAPGATITVPAGSTLTIV